MFSDVRPIMVVVLVTFSRASNAAAVVERCAVIARERKIRGQNGQNVLLGSHPLPIFGRDKAFVMRDRHDPRLRVSQEPDAFCNLDSKLQFMERREPEVTDAVLVTDGENLDRVPTNLRYRLHLVLVDPTREAALTGFELMRVHLCPGSIFIEYSGGREEQQGVAMIEPVTPYYSGARITVHPRGRSFYPDSRDISRQPHLPA